MNPLAEKLVSSNCLEGNVLMMILNQTSIFASSYFDAVAGLCTIILATWATVWMAYRFYEMAAGSPVDSKQALDELVNIVLAAVILKAPAWIWDFANVTLSVGAYAAGQAYAVVGAGTPANFGELVCYGLDGMDTAFFSPTKTQIAALGIDDIGNVLFIIPIIIGISFLMLKIMKYSCSPIMQLFAIFVLAPFIVMLSAFPAFKRVAFTSLKFLMMTIFEMLMVAGVVGVMMALLYTVGTTPQENGVLDIGKSEAWLGGPGYLAVLFALGFFYFAFDSIIGVPATILELIVSHVSFRAPAAQRAGADVARAVWK